MKPRLLAAAGLLVVLILAVLAFIEWRAAQAGLTVTYGANGIERLTYKGTVFEDLKEYPTDAFHIWHMKVTDLHGTVLTSGQYGWGENNIGRTWDPQAHTWTYNFVWGTIVLRFVQQADRLDMEVEERNDADSGVIVDGATLYPLTLHFPTTPEGYDDNLPRLAFNTSAPSITAARYGKHQVVAVVPDVGKSLYTGFVRSPGQPMAYIPLISGTTPDNLAPFQPHNDRPLAPGQIDRFTVSLRFAPASTGLAALAHDAIESWARLWPAELHWADRRIIGTVYLASSPQAPDAHLPGGYMHNPRRYFNDRNPADFDVLMPEGLALFQKRVIEQAKTSVNILRRLGAQGAVTWDIEGEEYPQATSYVCAPDQIARIAPEMESVIATPDSPYHGMKLDDVYFKIQRDAGFRVGVCVRPQHFTQHEDGTAEQASLADAQIEAELLRKMKYAHDRWGATLFYIDSSLGQNGAPLDGAVVRRLAAALPDALLMPEESTANDYAYAAPFQSFLFHGDTGTPAGVRQTYPAAFSVNLINDVAANKLDAALPELTDAVKHGDILMPHADYWQANNPKVVQIYKDAGR